MKTQDAKKETSSDSSDSSLPLKKRMKLSLVDDDDTTMVATAENSAPIRKYKGVFQQQNGKWGAQLYKNRRRIWLGTFISAEEAARAYDIALIKVREEDEDHQSGEDQETNKYLFEKELTPSDVGKLNRLVIPKKYAVRYLPLINVDRSEREEGEIEGDVEEVEVVFYDKAMKQWKFRYCYWKSSKSFIFTRGWSSFVKEKKLKEKDVVVFYNCKTCDVGGQSNNVLMIDVHYFSDNSSLVPEEVNKTVHEEEVNKTVDESCDPVEIKAGDGISSKVVEEEEETKSEKKKGGFMLFGVWIQDN